MSNSALGLNDRVRNRDASSTFAGKCDKKERELKGRMKPIEPAEELRFEAVKGIDRELETDPEFPPSRIRLADRLAIAAQNGLSLTALDLIKQIDTFRRSRFLPNAVSRLVNLHPDDIQTLAPLTDEPPPVKSASQNNAGTRRYSAAAIKRTGASQRKKGRPAKRGTSKARGVD